MGFLNPRADTKVLETLERWRHEKGMIGVKLHPHWHDYTTDLLFPLFARLEELGLPALIHLGFGRRGDYCVIAEKFMSQNYRGACRLSLLPGHVEFRAAAQYLRRSLKPLHR
ncbi:MAG: amidohydrolase family protein [Turneriella sp.]